MTDLLIHSMLEFKTLIAPALALCQVKRVVEIGAEHGGMSAILAQFTATGKGQLISIDPAPSTAFCDWIEQTRNVLHIAKPSLEVIEQQHNIDAWFIDGDHNWYTVLHELNEIRSVSERDSKPLLAFLHDVSWPCARRDCYYAPARIPPEYLHRHSFEGGVSLDSDHLHLNRGFRGNGHFAWAEFEGGPRNGVLTAVEDFVAQQSELGRELAWVCVPAVFGLGVLFDCDAPWAGSLADLLAPWHQNPLLMSLEENRLRNYLAVIDWQDRNQTSCNSMV
jgi:Methyltransferase domain